MRKNDAQRQMLRTGLLAHPTASAGGQPGGHVLAAVAALDLARGFHRADRAGIHTHLARAAVLELVEQGFNVRGQDFHQAADDVFARTRVTLG